MLSSVITFCYGIELFQSNALTNAHNKLCNIIYSFLIVSLLLILKLFVWRQTVMSVFRSTHACVYTKIWTLLITDFLKIFIIIIYWIVYFCAYVHFNYACVHTLKCNYGCNTRIHACTCCAFEWANVLHG